MKTTLRRMSQIALLGLLLFCTTAFSANAQGDQPDKGSAREQKSEMTVIPKTLPAIWNAVQSHQKDLHGVLAARNLDAVHHHAFAIRDLVAGMAAKSSSLAVDRKTSLGKSSSRVAGLAKLLDEAGDSGDSIKVAGLIVKLDAELKSIETLFPAKELGAPQSATDATKKMYSCPMHPEVTSDKPDKCPKCGMLLTMKEQGKGSMGRH